MNDELKKYLETSGCDLISVLPGIFLEDTTKTVNITGISTKIRTKNPPNMNFEG
jgi:hypothetical protein